MKNLPFLASMSPDETVPILVQMVCRIRSTSYDVAVRVHFLPEHPKCPRVCLFRLSNRIGYEQLKSCVFLDLFHCHALE